MKKNPVKRPPSTGVPVAQWLEPLTGVTVVLGWIPTWNSEMFSVAPNHPLPSNYHLHVVTFNNCLCYEMVQHKLNQELTNIT